MKRIIDYYLLQWKLSRLRKPLLLRGARQVGKTYAVRQLGKTYESFVEINLEKITKAHAAFQDDLNPDEMLIKLFAVTGQKIVPGKTLLFIDEIQVVPRAIIALRYFYEMMPELHVIAAGSLLDFAIQQVGIPVGRVQELYMHPVSFFEYLAHHNKFMAQEVLHHKVDVPMQEPMHGICLKDLLGRYLAIGGMPEAVVNWIEYKNPLEIAQIHASILNTYRQDFNKYAQKHEIKYVEKVFDFIPKQLGQKFKYSSIDGDYRKRELAPALDLLVTAGIAHKIYYSAGQGIPLGAQRDEMDYKAIFLDVGLAQTNLGLSLTDWFVQPQEEFVNKGALVENFVGQELAAYASPHIKNDLYYWHKEAAPQQAEIDFLVQINRKVIPVEVKSGDGRTLKSMHYFLDKHLQTPYGVKFSTQNYSLCEKTKIYSYPLYAIARVISDDNSGMKNAMILLFADPKIINYRATFGDQSVNIEQLFFDSLPIQEEVVVVNYVDDPFQPTLDQAIQGLKNIFSTQNHMIMNRLHELHKNVRVVQLMHQNVIVWQTNILEQLQKIDIFLTNHQL